MLFSVFLLFAQQDGEQEVFAPFVSRLKAASQGSHILLTWRDAEDVAGTNLIYRHTEQIQADNIEEAELIARVAQGTQSYADYPADTRPYFYAVVLQAEDGRQYPLFIPFRNITRAAAAAEEIGAPEELAADITGLTATVDGDAVIISYRSSQANRELLLYRSSRPLNRYTDLLGAVSYVVEAGLQTVVDRPPAGLEYHYAVLDSELVKLARVELTRGENTTSAAVRIPIPETARAHTVPAPIRAVPLPFLSLDRTVFSGETLGPRIAYPETRELSSATEEAVGKILRGIVDAGPARMSVAVLEIDQAEAQGGEDYVLKSIIRESLVSEEFAAAEEKLVDFLSVRRETKLAARACFYLGQARFLQEHYREALLDFLAAREEFYADADPWVDACFDRLIR
jgi:hypothetical protein